MQPQPEVRYRPRCLRTVVVLIMLLPGLTLAGRQTVLKQIKLPHNYYYREMFLPQWTSGPSALSWSPDSRSIVYSMQGSLWRQRVDGTTAEQITDGPGYDYQPDWSPDGRRIVFARYNDDAVDLQLLDLGTGQVTALTHGGDVNVEPRWSPDGDRLAWVSTRGTGHFHIFVGDLQGTKLAGHELLPDRKSDVYRYYYSPYDHDISPAWSPDGKQLLFVSNHEIVNGTGPIWRMNVDGSGKPVPVREEETTWHARPDWSPDGKRFVYASYLGRQWHQVWISTAGGGDPFPLTYGDYDNTMPRWSPDGKHIAYISNRGGTLSLWILDMPGAAQRALEIKSRKYLKPMGTLDIHVADENHKPVAARISIVGADGRAYAPDDAWTYSDDGFDREVQKFETHYYQTQGEDQVTLPAGPAHITVWRGLEHRIVHWTLKVPPNRTTPVHIDLEPIGMPVNWSDHWESADVHVHMNYAGTYHNTPAHMALQAQAEDLDVVHDIVVNKEQRIPDIHFFSTQPDPASTGDVLLLYGQEYHTSYWGHLGILNPDDHFLLPEYASYNNTAAASPDPTNADVADLAHAQHALVGYVHPFDEFPDPDKDAPLSNELPVDVALGKVDYYEVVGFSDHIASATVWQRLLNCGFHPVAAAGTDFMGNFASLRGPVGLARVYVHVDHAGGTLEQRRAEWTRAFAAGHTFATNGPLLQFTVNNAEPGDRLHLPGGKATLHYKGLMRSIVPVDHLEVVMNDKVIRSVPLTEHGTRAEFEGTVQVDRGAWLLLRAWSKHSDPAIYDIYPYASTNPVFVDLAGAPFGGQCNADYFIKWIDRVRESAAAHDGYNTPAEREHVLGEIDRARAVFEKLGSE